MAELPDLDVGQALQNAGIPAAGGEMAAPPAGAGMPPGGMPPGGAPQGGMPGEGGLPGPDEIDQILAGMGEEAMVPEPEPEGTPGPDFESILQEIRGEQDDGEKSLLSNRVEELEKQLQDVMGRFQQQKFQSETARVRGSIDHAVKNALANVSVGHVKLDKAAADFIEGTLVYRLAQQQQRNPQAPVDTDAIQRFATKAAQALSRWGKEHAKKTETEPRKASVGIAARPKSEDFELKTDADFDKYVAAFIGKGG